MAEDLLRVITYEQACLLPADESVCRICASRHAPEEPHNATSPHFHHWFAGQQRQRGQAVRQPTWEDAAAHCDEQTRHRWQELLRYCGIDVSLGGERLPR